jgi:hypothetical protein
MEKCLERPSLGIFDMAITNGRPSNHNKPLKLKMSQHPLANDPELLKQARDGLETIHKFRASLLRLMVQYSELTGSNDPTLVQVQDLTQKLEDATKKAPSIRLALAVQRSALANPEIRSCPYCDDSDGVDGILSFFADESSGTFLSNGTLKVAGSSGEPQFGRFSNVAEVRTGSSFTWRNQSGQYIEYTFSCWIRVTAFTIVARGLKTRPGNWKIEVSASGDWIPVAIQDRSKEDIDDRARVITATYFFAAISDWIHKVRLTQTDRSFVDGADLELEAFELFGEVWLVPK